MKNTTMRALVKSLVFLGAALSLGACTSTHFVSTWQDPNIAFGALDGDKIAAFLISENEGYRRSVEEALAGELTARGAQGIAGYTLLSNEANQDEELAKKELDAAGVEAVITLRIVSEETETTTSPGNWYQVPSYRYWNGYWYPSWRTVYEPGYTIENEIVRVETMIYAMDSGELIWAGVSKTTNPGNVEAFVNDLARATDDAIKKSRLMR